MQQIPIILVSGLTRMVLEPTIYHTEASIQTITPLKQLSFSNLHYYISKLFVAIQHFGQIKSQFK
jgi:hypothetical protein